MPAAPERMLGARALVLVAVAIGIGALGMALSWHLGRDASLEPETYIRYAIVITLGVYAVVGALIVTQLVPGVRLRWQVGSPAGGILFGALVGGGLSAALLTAVSAAAGHLSPDPRIVTMMSEGDAAHLVVSALIACACAPLVEEVLFRGLLLESLRNHGSRVAVLVSGAAFAVWHLNPAALRYYALMGALLGVLYLKRGLICSISAHVAFNGVLTVAALAVVLAPAKVVTGGHVSLRAPGGWSTTHEGGADLALTGPSGATLLVVEVPTVTPPSPDVIVRRINEGLLTQVFPGLQVDVTKTRQVKLPVGAAVEIDVIAQGHRGTMVFVPLAGESVDMVFLSGGSVKAQTDFPRMLASLRVS
jgi:membrane protease YdiL (CAAX protease family)